MYPWYRDGNFTQFCGQPNATIKTENGYSDCMLGFDQYSNMSNFNNFNKAALVWPNTDGVNKGNGGITSGGTASPPQHGSPAQNMPHHFPSAWINFVAEHMPHAADPMYHMWNGVENKLSNGTEQHHSPSPMNKGNLDERLDRGITGGMPLSELAQNMGHGGSLYPRSNGSTSSSPPAVSTPSMGLIIPQPINASKISSSQPNQGGNNVNLGGSNVPRKYQCKMCPQIFGSKAELQAHQQYHMREAKPYKCSQCPKAFANSSYLTQHTRIHLGIKPYRCDICQRKFTQLSHLQQHIRTHTGDKPYKCRHAGCNKAFSQLSNLQSHSRSHQTDKPYKCNSCYKCFVDEASLLEHIPKHKESKHLKTHICQYCGKSYTQETYLQKHLQKHAERIEKRPPLAQELRQSHPYSWPKHENQQLEPMESRMSELCLQMQAHDQRHMVHREEQRQEDLRSPAHINANLPYDSLPTKTTSAFTPFQTSMLPSSQLTMAAATSSNRYLPYDPLYKANSQMSSIDMKPAQFPNQLISLNQIRNYANPNMNPDILLKEKGISQ